MSCPVCNSNNDTMIKDVFLLSRLDIKKLINGNTFHYGHINLKQCRSCGVLRT